MNDDLDLALTYRELVQITRRARQLYPTSPRLAHKWARAKLHLGHRLPRVVIGSDVHANAYRTPRQAGFSIDV